MSLRAEAYLDPKWFDAKLKALFARTWQWVYHVERLAQPGNYVTTTVAGMPLVLLRDRAGQLRAFYNVCKHRAHELIKNSVCLDAYRVHAAIQVVPT